MSAGQPPILPAAGRRPGEVSPRCSRTLGVLGAEQARLDSTQVQFNRIAGPREIARLQRFHQIDVVGLVNGSSLSGVAQPLEVAPELSLARAFDLTVHLNEQWIGTRRHDRMMQGKVPDFE